MTGPQRSPQIRVRTRCTPAKYPDRHLFLMYEALLKRKEERREEEERGKKKGKRKRYKGIPLPILTRV